MALKWVWASKRVALGSGRVQTAGAALMQSGGWRWLPAPRPLPAGPDPSPSPSSHMLADGGCRHQQRFLFGLGPYPSPPVRTWVCQGCCRSGEVCVSGWQGTEASRYLGGEMGRGVCARAGCGRAGASAQARASEVRAAGCSQMRNPIAMFALGSVPACRAQCAASSRSASVWTPADLVAWGV